MGIVNTQSFLSKFKRFLKTGSFLQWLPLAWVSVKIRYTGKGLKMFLTFFLPKYWYSWGSFLST